MNKYSIAKLATAGALAVLSVAAQAQVGVSVSVNQPGFYGRVDVGNTPPAVLYPQPIIIQPGPVAVQQRPIYLRVPSDQSRDWKRYCGRYRACGQPVYFVREDERGRGPDRGRDDDHDHGPRGNPGKGHGRGHGHGHDH